jgi:flagellin-like hook-associated protein FlgL
MSSVSTIGQNTFLNAQILNIESQLNTLSNEVSSGKKSDTFSGINTVSQLSLQLTNEQTVANGYLTNITNANTLIDPIQSVLQQITDIANQVRNDALVASSDALPVTQGNATLQAEATDALNQISSLLNTRVGSTYLFGGRNTTSPPMPNFGSVSSASSIVGQVANLQTQAGLSLVNNPASGDSLFDAIQSFLNNGVTKITSAGATAPAPFGYTGESGEPGGSLFRFSTSAAVAAGATSVTVAQGSDLPSVGQYIEFGTTPPTNAAYQVTGVAGSTITFTRTPATFTGVDFNIPAGTSVNVYSSPVVTTVGASSATTSTDTVYAQTTAAAALNAQTVTVPIADAGDFTVGESIKFGAAAQTYKISAINATTGQITFGNTVTDSGTASDSAVLAGAGATSYTTATAGIYAAGENLTFAGVSGTYTVSSIVGTTVNFAPPLAAGGPGTYTISVASPGAASGATSFVTPNPGSYQAGDTLSFQGVTGQYTVTSVAGNTINIQALPNPPGGGLAAAITAPLNVSVTSGLTAAIGANTSVLPASGVTTLTAGTTTIPIGNLSDYHVGDAIAFASVPGTYYTIKTVNASSTPPTIVVSQLPNGGGLAGAINALTDSITVYPSYQAGANVINVGSTTGVTAGMSVKFSNSNTTYSVSAVLNGTQISIVPLGQTQGPGLENPIPAILPVLGQQVTAQFGTAVLPLSVQIDNGVTLDYGIAADAQPFRQVLGALFALATTNLNTTTQAGFREIAARSASQLSTGSRGVTTLASDLGVKQQTLDATQTRQKDFVTTLQAQLSNLNDVDMSSAVSQLTQTQTQLQASFQLLSTMKNLTLANYL